MYARRKGVHNRSRRVDGKEGLNLIRGEHAENEEDAGRSFLFLFWPFVWAVDAVASTQPVVPLGCNGPSSPYIAGQGG